MRSFKKIVVPVFLFVSVTFLVNHNLFSYSQPVITVLESTAGDSGSSCFSDTQTSSEEDNTFCLHCNSLHYLYLTGNHLFSPHTAMPPELFLSIWLPPDKS